MNLTDIKGLKEKRLSVLNDAGIFTPEDLINTFPKTLEDYTKRFSVRELAGETGCVKLRFLKQPKRAFYGKFKNGVTKGQAVDEFGNVFYVNWYNNVFIKPELNKTYLAYGKVSEKDGSLINPKLKEENEAGIYPVYRIKGIGDTVFSGFVKEILKREMPEDAELYEKIHFPLTSEDNYNARCELAVKELSLLLCAYRIIKKSRRVLQKQPYENVDLNGFIKKFPFEFTSSQLKAVKEIENDMRSPYAMNRILQGDVGSGKTAVAFCAAFIASSCGQTAYLAPTEVLACQHYKSALKYFGEDNTVLLTSSLKAAERRLALDKIETGKAKIIVGTHSILSDSVKFADLRLCITDEQHRFGVAQRNRIENKGVCPDVLVMSATPIPRTLSLVLYGDLDISVLREKPSNRKTTETYVMTTDKTGGLIEFIFNRIKCGERAFIVCPRIDEDEDSPFNSAESVYKIIEKTPLAPFTALLHGRMGALKKDEIFSGFKKGDIKVLVSTTVIEVGVDVPDATVMVVFNAERFGLSSLHQLRGRVGRSGLQSYCFLVSDSISSKTCERLSAFKNTEDGFKIAEIDFETRGAGDFMGERQHGCYEFIANLPVTPELINRAKEAADALERNRGDRLKTMVEKSKYGVLVKDVTLN